MLNCPRRSFPAVVLSLSVMVSSGALVGCGDERLADDHYGFIDLAPYYFDGSSAQSPTAALPKTLNPQRGWVSGLRAEYYDFGLVGAVAKRSDVTTPDYAQVPPMYFFFDARKNPLFSKPIYERRTGLWHMRGGRDVLDLNPDDSKANNGTGPFNNRDDVYSVRRRKLLLDAARGSSPHYQRPIIDVLPGAGIAYTGLWEIWEVTVPAEYEPDAIKTLETLEKGIDAGEFSVRRTQKVINCPVLDDRTYVTPSAMAYGIPRPRIEVWYRTKQGSCYLANGWETLGDAGGNLYKANQDAQRLDTFDVLRFAVGSGVSERTTVTAPLSPLYQPMVEVADQNPDSQPTRLRYAGDYLSTAMPRMTADMPPGYRPIRYMWDIVVPQDPPYQFGAFKQLELADPQQLVPRKEAVAAVSCTGNACRPFTRNFPLIGAAYPCGFDMTDPDKECQGLFAGPGVPLKCNKVPSLDVALGTPPPGKTVAQLLLDREGGARCDVPPVEYGEFCAPGIARCDTEPVDRDADGKPVLVEGKEVPKTPKVFTTDPASGAETEAALPTQVLRGYSCFPSPVGFCHFRCDSDVPQMLVANNVNFTYEGPDKKELKKTINAQTDNARCRGLPGYRCVNPSGVSPTKLRVCVRGCATADPDKLNEQLCSGIDGKKMPIPSLQLKVSLNAKVQARNDIHNGMTCSNRGLGGAPQACAWDPAYYPRDPATVFIPTGSDFTE